MSRFLPVYRRQLLSTCAIIGISWAFSPTAQAFDPNADSETYKASQTPVMAMSSSDYSAAPLYTPGTAAPSVGHYVSPLAPVAMPQKPLYPARETMAAPAAAPMVTSPAVASTPSLPPVDPAVAARAEAILKAETTQQPVAVTPAAAAPMPAAPATATMPNGFIAPAPVLAISPTADAPAQAVTVQASQAPSPAAIAAVPAATPAPVAAPEPLAETPAAVAAAPELSDETRTILSHVPSKLDAPMPQTATVNMDRVSPEVKQVLGQKAEVDTYDAVGLSIKVSRPGLDTNFELNRAYTALMGGDTQTAIETYKNILSVEPRNEEALFGLAATYHRLGDLDHARPLYGMLLQVNPNHREGLNNFLVMVSDESPEDALPELQRLEDRNPDFSPIPAQIALVLDKLGYADAAREKMLRAIELAPDNMTYKYNLAVMLDRQGQYADAAAMYRDLVQASLHGATVPASTDQMQNRLNYLVTELTRQRTAALNSN